MNGYSKSKTTALIVYGNCLIYSLYPSVLIGVSYKMTEMKVFQYNAAFNTSKLCLLSRVKNAKFEVKE